ncbi:MAG: mannose-phosphate guanylyltransferase [Solirubrobacteraceae bacterium]|nr:mannose-phosphate guanylyltransferase [Solirubrobacteraceae bacterium]
MQAVILVGGEGTRLRPLTSTVPKPVVPLVDRPLIGYMLEWLRGHGVDEVIMSLGFLATGVRNVLGDGSDYGVSLRFVEEPEPRGTAGALKYAEEFLHERFLMLNGDVLTDLDLTAQIAQHEATGATGTLALVPVPDPSSYGLVRLREDKSVEEFLEKPAPGTVLDTNLISAGAYVLERSVLDLIEPDRMVSIEREVWPRLVGEGLYGFDDQDAYWLDIGTPQRYLEATFDILGHKVQTGRNGASDSHHGAGTQISASADVGSLVVLGEGVSVGDGTIVERCVVLEGTRIGAGCVLRDCIVGPGAHIGDRTQVIDGAMLGEGVTVGTDNVIARGARLFPGVEVPDGGIAF